MTSKRARRLAVVLKIWDVLALLGASTLAVPVALDYFKPQTPAGANIAWEPAEAGKVPPPQLDSFGACWQAQIIEDAPVEVKSKPQEIPEKPKAKPKQEVDIALEWVGAAVHSDARESYCIVKDKRKNCQILLRQGQTMPGTSWIVEEISEQRIKFANGQQVAEVLRPTPWKNLGQGQAVPNPAKPENPGLRLAVQGDRITVLDEAGLGSYGLKKQDQLVAIDDERIKDLDHLKAAMNRPTKNSARVSVLRDGRIVSLLVPGQALGPFEVAR